MSSTKCNKGIISIILCFLLIVLGAGCSQTGVSAKVAKQLEVAVKYLSENKFEEAVLAYNEIIKIDAKNLNAFKGLAKVYILQGEYNEAEKIYQDGLKVVEDKNQLKISLAGLYLDRHKSEQAEKIYNELIANTKTYIPAYEGLAKIFISQGRLDAAIDKLKQCIEFNSENDRGYSLLAETYMLKGEKEQAIDFAIKSLRVNTNQSAAYQLLGKLFNNDWLKMADYGSLLLTSDETVCRTLKIYAYYNAAQYEKAIAEYIALPDKSKRSYKSIVLAALAYLKNGDERLSSELIDRIDLKSTGNPILYADVARYYLSKGNINQAKRIAIEGISLNDSCIDNYLVLVDLAQKENKSETSYYEYLLMTRYPGSVRALIENLKEDGIDIKFLSIEEKVLRVVEIYCKDQELEVILESPYGKPDYNQACIGLETLWDDRAVVSLGEYGHEWDLEIGVHKQSDGNWKVAYVDEILEGTDNHKPEVDGNIYHNETEKIYSTLESQEGFTFKNEPGSYKIGFKVVNSQKVVALVAPYGEHWKWECILEKVHDNWRVVAKKDAMEQSISLKNDGKTEDTNNSKPGNALDLAEVKPISRYTKELHDIQGNLYVVYIYSKNEESYIQESSGGGGNAGDSFCSGNYKAALQKNRNNYVQVQSVDLHDEKYGASFNLNRNMVYTVTAEGQPDILVVEQYGSSNGNFARLFYVNNGELRSIEFKTPGESFKEVFLKIELHADSQGKFITVDYTNNDALWHIKKWSLDPNNGILNIVSSITQEHY